MKNKQVYRPLSIPFVFCCILLNIFVVGLFSLLIIGIIEFEWIYILISLLSLPILIYEDIKLLTWKIQLNENSIVVKSNVFDKYFKTKSPKILNIYYKDIKEIIFKETPIRILFIYSYHENSPIPIYLKQFSNKQVKNLLKQINAKLPK